MHTQNIIKNMEMPLRPPKRRYGITLTETTLGTFTGLRVDPRALEPHQVNIPDIAHSLSLQCRFGGHSREFYSVAQHSVAVSQQVPAEFALVALLHDASEAYLCDLPRPIKALFPSYKVLEHKIQAVVCERFGLEYPFPAEVKIADTVELLTEANCFLEMPIYDEVLLPRTERLISQAPSYAERAFLARYEELTTK